MMKLSRREFLKTMGLGAGAAGLGSVVGFTPPMAEAAAESLEASMPEKVKADLSTRLQVPGSTDPLAAELKQIAGNMEPVIPHDDQAAAAAKKLADLEKKTGIIINPDTSVDVYFGPEPLAGKEANWVQTVPGKGWWVGLRHYGPLEPMFDKTWRPGELERID